MTSTQTLARVTGLVYVTMAVTSGFGLKAMEGLETGDAATALAHFQTARTILELSIVANALTAAVYIALALLLHRLFSPIANFAASLLLVVVAVSSAVLLVAVARQLDIVSLLDGVKFGMTHRTAGDKGLPLLSPEQAQFQLTLILHGYDNLITVCTFFWGVWLLPFGWMMLRAGGIGPSVLGVLLLLGGIGYTLAFFRPVLYPDFHNALFNQLSSFVFGVPAVVCEIGTMLWLLIMGAPGRLRTA